MHIDPYIVLGSAVVGFLVGLTGAGGGALMTPMLILLFSIKPSAAISSDLVAAVFMRPFGAAVHITKKTVNFRLVGWMVLGSVPMAFVGAYLLHLMGHTKTSQANIEKILGAALLVGAAAMVLRYCLDRRSGQDRAAIVHTLEVRPVPTVLIGMVGGVIVGLTSVGSGSLMIVLLLFLYPMLGANQLVGTDLTQAVPLTMAAALGALIFGHVEFSVTTSIIVGSVPAVLIGAFLSSRAPDKLHPSGHHLRDLRLGPQVRRRGHHRARVDPVRHAAGARRLLPGLRAAVAGGCRHVAGRRGGGAGGSGGPRRRSAPGRDVRTE